MNFLETYLLLNNLYTTEYNQKRLVEAKHSDASPINLSDCRVVTSDVIDIRGELETSSCLEYNGELTRVQARIVIIRNTENGKEFLGKNYGRRIALPGGGYDMDKDSTIVDTAIREASEEFNFVLRDVKDTGIAVWSHRDDPWVTKHVANPEDRWTGYYTMYVTAEAAGFGDNDNPEELDKWQWLPIEKLSKVNAKLASYVDSLTEAWGDGDWGEQDLTMSGKLSYCCENPTNLLKILESGLIKAASAPETHDTDIVPSSSRGRPKFAKYPYVSFSKQLYSHAYRRPNKWSFGIVIDEAALRAKGYDLVDRDHTYNSLSFEALFTTDDNKHYMTKTSLYGFVEVSKEVYDIIYEAMLLKSNKMYERSDANEIVKGTLNQKDAWQLRTKKASTKSIKAANVHLKNLGFSSKTAYPGSAYHSMQYVVTLKELDEVKPGSSKFVLDYLLDNTYYNEGELRFWCKNNEPGVEFEPADLHGVILPKVAMPEEVDLEESALAPHHEEAVNKILEYVDKHNLDVFTHGATDETHLADLKDDRGIKSRGSR